MKFEKIANSIGTIGLIISLVFLGYETHVNTQTVRATSNDVINNTNIEFIRMLAENEELGKLFEEASESWNELDETGKRTSNYLFIQYFRQNENMFYQNRIGVFDDDLWLSHKVIVTSYFHKNGVQEWWAVRRGAFSEDFRNFLEASDKSAGLKTIKDL
ncbi:hypothetical protein [Ekhidna sp.]|uniref:hypothetical protein n=1 Tax=Ekhidna sp. TaxID=2608089 RepID=UPI0032EC88B1